MSGNPTRLQAIAEAAAHATPEPFGYEELPSGELFGMNAFSLDVMEKMLSKGTYKKVKAIVKDGAPFDVSLADEIASAMKTWAMDRGATHFSHVFYPLTGRMAQKHDSFFDPSGSSVIAELTGDALIQQEPDGSSFPGGGLRATHQARGYTAWDITSTAYLLENENGTTLCIPTSFISWTGESMDFKTPVLRAQAAMGKQAARVLAALGEENVANVTASAGPEQEYFLVDRSFYFLRPDLLAAGRTLFGMASPKGQEFDDHYFGVINDRVQAFMFDFERECYKLGIPVTTRHNEVSPGQYEVAPVYQSANQAADNQQLVMHLLQSIAEKHDFACLLHEKPFAGVNGSGKHLNFSIGNATQGNLLEPGDTPHTNTQFLVFCAGIIGGVFKNATMLRAAIASANNDHRLGANEAPPAIISIFLGRQLSDVMEQIKSGNITGSLPAGTLDLGVPTLPILPAHAGDRNRTSPFAFTGNKFEFRAVGSSQSIGGPLMMLNAIMAEAFDSIATALEGGAAPMDVVKDILNECGAVLFEGDGYAEAWHNEAAERGLPNLRTSADALPVWGSEETVALLAKYDILGEAETHARMEVFLEQYDMQVNVESNLVVEIAKTVIYPAATRYMSELAGTAAAMQAAGVEPDTSVLSEVSGLASSMMKAVAELEALKAEEADGPVAQARHCADAILPKMLEVREAADALEGLVADDLWPLPTYQEMLFIR